ncbi:MAG: helix-hairpin-helix domain-containing protein [Candidatus Edwardsbacteria bacterium]|nr:helix-hairpin-helix domain-containing protein [Candidatus Edwardsbacteria bacterium]
MKDPAIKKLQTIPGVGPSIARDLYQLGIRKVSDLRGRDPEKLYLQSCHQAGKQIDRCLLYVYRCAVYYASAGKHDPKFLKWWNWKDGIIDNKKRG